MSRWKRLSEWLMFRSHRDKIPSRSDDLDVLPADLHDGLCLGCGQRWFSYPLARLPLHCPTCYSIVADTGPKAGP